MTRWWATGLEPPNSGAGVLQRRLHLGLRSLGDEIGIFGPEDDGEWNGARYSTGQLPRLMRLKARRLLARPEPSLDCSLLLSTPYPIRNRIPSVLVLLDLRWRTTRGWLPACYRARELKRVLRRVDFVFTISARTLADLREWMPDVQAPSQVLPLGPGLFEAPDMHNGQPGTVLLLGNAAHKRNEIAAKALAMARPNWAERFVCLNTTDAVTETLVDAFGASAVTRMARATEQEVKAAYHGAAVFVLLAREEGFGFPYLEALAAGCNVVAVRQSLTEELLSTAGVLILDGTTEQLAEQFGALDSWPSQSRRAAQVGRHNWMACASAVSGVGKRLTRATAT